MEYDNNHIIIASRAYSLQIHYKENKQVLKKIKHQRRRAPQQLHQKIA